MDKLRFTGILACIAALCVCVGLLGGCGGNHNTVSNPGNTSNSSVGKAVYHKISAAQAKRMMGEGTPYILVDVRTEAEFKAKRIEGAILIPYDEIGRRADSDLPGTNALIFTYCKTGRRSSAAAHTLVDMGYTNVYDMGGIETWPYNTVSG